MAEVTTREELKQYCLRQLGKPVIRINLADQQMEDLIDTAFQFYQDWHCEGSERLYLKHQLTPSVMRFAAALPPLAFQMGNGIVGQTSGCTAQVAAQAPDNMSITIWQIQGPLIPGQNTVNPGAFLPGEMVMGPNGTFALAATDPVTFGDLDNHFIPIPHQVLSVVKVFAVSTTLTTNFLFDPVYYEMFDMLFNFNSLDLISYELLKERINQINDMLVGQKPIRYNRHMEKLYVDFDWKRATTPNAYLIIDCYRLLDPSTYPQVYNDYFLKQYTTALFRIQWGNNLSKFAAIQLPGGVTLDGPRILEQGKAEKLELEDQIKAGRWAEPLALYVG